MEYIIESSLIFIYFVSFMKCSFTIKILKQDDGTWMNLSHIICAQEQRVRISLYCCFTRLRLHLFSYSSTCSQPLQPLTFPVRLGVDQNALKPHVYYEASQWPTMHVVLFQTRLPWGQFSCVLPWRATMLLWINLFMLFFNLCKQVTEFHASLNSRKILEFKDHRFPATKQISLPMIS